MFIDTAKISIKAGDGGNGCASFRRDKLTAHGGPDGGDGGNGGNIVFTVDTNLSTLLEFRYARKYAAKRGGDGMSLNRHGANGEDCVIRVPAGTIIRVMNDSSIPSGSSSHEGFLGAGPHLHEKEEHTPLGESQGARETRARDEENGLVVADLAKAGDAFVAARGGSGGWGNAHFATPTRQAPNFAKAGLRGEEREIVLELMSIADVGLIGLPNVGKSTLLSVISAARPKIGDYQFTTLVPNLGVAQVDGESFTVADIPGLIEGAAEGAGLGHDFLRHIERTRVLVHVIDASDFAQMPPPEAFRVINKELTRYSEELAEREQILVLNKTDLIENINTSWVPKGTRVFEISAATRKGVDGLMKFVLERVKAVPKKTIDVFNLPDNRKNPKEFSIVREGEAFRISGENIESLAIMTNFNEPESSAYFQRALKVRGIHEAMIEAGVKEGSLVRIADMEFEFEQ